MGLSCQEMRLHKDHNVMLPNSNATTQIRYPLKGIYVLLYQHTRYVMQLSIHYYSAISLEQIYHEHDSCYRA